MCRHLAYLGPPTSLSAILLEPPHGLRHQSYAPADMRGGGTVNADGFGAGWYVDGAAPVRYRSASPIWSDTSFAALAAVTTSGAVLAAVRSATTGMPVTDTAAAPFTEGPWLFSHNGVVRGWPDSVAGLAAALPVTDLLTLDAPTDAALLWALVRHRLRAGVDGGKALADVVTAVAAAAPGSRLNLLLTDGATIWATAWDHALSVLMLGPASDPSTLMLGPASDPSTLMLGPASDPSVRRDTGLVLVASEPLDDHPGWVAVPDRHLVTARPGGHVLLDLTPDGDP